MAVAESDDSGRNKEEVLRQMSCNTSGLDLANEISVGADTAGACINRVLGLGL
jgi:hypothetical protein